MKHVCKYILLCLIVVCFNNCYIETGACVKPDGTCNILHEDECDFEFKINLYCSDLQKMGSCINYLKGECINTLKNECEFNFIEEQICYYSDPPGTCIDQLNICTNVNNKSKCALDETNIFEAYSDC